MGLSRCADVVVVFTSDCVCLLRLTGRQTDGAQVESREADIASSTDVVYVHSVSRDVEKRVLSSPKSKGEPAGGAGPAGAADDDRGTGFGATDSEGRDGKARTPVMDGDFGAIMKAMYGEKLEMRLQLLDRPR